MWFSLSYKFYWCMFFKGIWSCSLMIKLNIFFFFIKVNRQVVRLLPWFICIPSSFLLLIKNYISIDASFLKNWIIQFVWFRSHLHQKRYISHYYHQVSIDFDLAYKNPEMIDCSRSLTTPSLFRSHILHCK